MDAAKQWEAAWDDVSDEAVARKIEAEEEAGRLIAALADSSLSESSVPSARPTGALISATDRVAEAGAVVERLWLVTDGTYPNSKHPLLFYRSCYDQTRDGMGAALLERNGWDVRETVAVGTDHAYHSNTWVALLCTGGEADVQLGGPSGPWLRPIGGDLLLVPPGVPYRQGAIIAAGFALLVALPQHTGCSLGGVPADSCRGVPSPLEAVNLMSCPSPLQCPRYGTTPPWAGGFGRLLLDPRHQTSAVARVASALRRAEEPAVQRVTRPEAPIRVIGPQRGPGKQRRLADGSWEFPRRNVVYAMSDGGPTHELGCSDLRVISVADVKRWVAARDGSRAQQLQVSFFGSVLDDATTLGEANVDYESELWLSTVA